MQRGFTLIEILIGVAVFTTFALGVYQGYSAVYAAISHARFKALAADLANERFEIIKNLPYSSVGVSGGNPTGVVLASENVVRGGVTFTAVTSITNVDDPFDGLSGGADVFPADYKSVEISVNCSSCKNFVPVVFTGRVAPKNLESA